MNYATRMEQARISDELDSRRIANVSILSAPSTPIEPIYPRKIALMLIALGVGLMLATGLALLIEYFNDIIRSAADLEGFEGIPVLGSVKIAAGQTGR
jgi:capsular polysaccharide biosynthesis protein